MRRLVVMAFVVLAGCTSVPKPAPFDGAGSYVPVRGFVFAETSLTSTVAADRPRAYILLDPTKKDRNQRVCDAFVNLPTGTETVNPDAKIVTTWWMTRESTATGRTCKQLVDRYDYQKATAIRASYGLGTQGIYIFAVDQNNKAFTIDISKANKAQVNDIMLMWLKTAQEQAPTNATVAISSESLLDKTAAELCGTKITKVSANDVGAAVVTGGGSVLGRILIVVGKELVCQVVA